MNALHDSDNSRRFDPPLWSIAFAVLIILSTPLFLYSLAPPGPLRAGDTVFSEGEQQVRIARPATDARLQSDPTCLLNPGNPLIILELPHERTDGDILAAVQGNPVAEWPFCPSQTQVLIHLRQIVQKPDTWKATKRGLTETFDR